LKERSDLETETGDRKPWIRRIEWEWFERIFVNVPRKKRGRSEGEIEGVSQRERKE
jgi:hypothetical protein